MASWLSQHLLYFIILSGLDQVILSERSIGDVYAAGRLTHVKYLWNNRYESFAFRGKLDNALKLIFYTSHIRDVHTLYDPPFSLIVTPRKYLCYPYYFAFLFNSFPYCLDQIWCLVYYHTYWFFVIHLYENASSGNSASHLVSINSTLVVFLVFKYMMSTIISYLLIIFESYIYNSFSELFHIKFD